MPQNSPLRISLVLAWLLFVAHAFAAAERVGQVTFSGLPLPGATVVATMGDARATTTTDQQGMFRFADLADGVWTFHVEMTGFVPITRDVTIGADAAIPPFELTLRPFAEVQREAGAGAPTAARSTSNDPLPQGIVSSAAAQASAAAARSGATTGASGGNASGAASGQSQSAAAAASTASANAASANAASANATTAAAAGAPGSNSAAAGGDPFGTADGLLINGSVNNGAASPFAQSAAFGNNRPGQRSVYNGGVGLILGNSAWDARPYSFSSVPSQKPVYTDYQFLGSFGGPIRFPGVRTRSTLFLGYQRIADTNTTTQSAIVPTLLERNGDFSESLDAFGQPVQVIDPETGLPFKDGVIPPERMSPQARALLGYYPTPNAAGSGRFNYQAPIVAASHQDNVQARLTHALSPRDQLATSASYQRTSIDTLTLFGFEDSTVTSGFDVMAQWQHRVSLFMTTRLRYQFTTLSTSTTPFFAGTRNVSGDAGIGGNNQDPSNWGPPTLGFSSGIAGLTDAQFARNHNQTHAWGSETLWSHNRHNLTFGGDLRLVHNNIESQQDPRGTFGFTGALTASDLGDFLLGVPHTSSIAFGNADKFLRSSGYDAYLSDDWRVSPALTVTAGVRWEFEAPITETQDRLANLDIAKEFTNTASVTAAAPSGALTGELYPRSLIRSDPFGIQPRLGVAWRPIPGSSLVIRGGYGIYRNSNVYQSIAQLLAQQPPFSKTTSVENNADLQLTLANGFPAATSTSNTIAVDPNLRVGFAQNWQVSAQRDLPASLTVIATYLGTHGSRLLQEFAPNTYPLGAVNPCPTCPSGYVYLTSNGSSSRHAAQLQVRRRLRNGLTATVQYTLAQANDDAGAFTGVNLSGSAIAQDWLHPEAEWGPSNFDQRHLVTASVQYTTGVGVSGGGLLDGWKGALAKGWTFTSQLTTGSGMPVTPVYLTPLNGTGINGAVRADVVNASNDGAPDGSYLDPAAYAAPKAGEWGTAGRNSARGPAQFALNAGVARSFSLNERLTLDWRLDATNVLNYVTFSGINTIFGSPQFGLPNRANPMRKIQSTLRLRF